MRTIILLIISLFLWSIAVFSQDIDTNAIIQIESSGNPLAISFLGAKYGRGLYQISEVALADYNAHNRTEIAPEALFNPIIVNMVAKGYIAIIKQYLKNYGLPVGTKHILWAWSAGIGNVKKGIMPDETIQYLTKYRNLTK